MVRTLLTDRTARQDGYGVPGDARTSRWLGRWLVALGCVVTLVAWGVVAGLLMQDAQARFTAFGEARELLFDRHVKRLVDVARSFQGLFLSSEDVSSAEFKIHYDILQVRENLPEVLSAHLDVWDAESRRLSTRYRQPDDRGPQADPVVDADRTRWIDQARDHNVCTLTPPHRLPEGFEGVDIGVPVYRPIGGRGDPGSAALRRQQFLGLIQVSVDLSRLIANVVPEGIALPYRVKFSDIGTTDGRAQPEIVLFEGGGAREHPLAARPWLDALRGPALERRYVIEVGQRLWMLSMHQDPVLYLLRAEALLVLLSGALGTLVLAMTLRQMQRRADRSVEVVRAMDQQAALDNARLRGVIDQSTEGIITFDADGHVLAANPAAHGMFRRKTLCAELLSDLIAPADRPALLDCLRRLVHAGTGAEDVRIELRALRGDGAEFELSLNCRPLLAEPRGEWLGLLRDQSVSLRAAAAMRKLAQHDALTGLINREAFQKRLAQVLIELRAGAATGAPVPLAMMIIDLDRFKKINETLGHLVGDRVLLEIAARLRGALDDQALLARLGGDEFAVLLVEPEALHRIEEHARGILRLLCEPLEIDGHRLRVSCSIGITGVEAMDDLAGVDDVALMSQADSAMYVAKNAGRSQLHVHRREDHQNSPAQLQLEVDLHRALERHELELYFQPQFDCRTRALVGAEALLRWKHHSQGMVSPVEFIPMAEESGLIVPIGRWVLDEACRHALTWQEVAGRPLSVAVNLASRQMVDDDIVSAVRESLARHALPASLLELEITESSAVTDTVQARGLLDRLAELGVGVSIDDFGVGYSSLSYLRDLPVQRFKIDRSFLVNVPHDAGSSRLVSAMISMARSLEVGLVAEGVETQEQLDFLAQQQCEVAQGFLLGRPVPAPEFMRRLRDEWLIG
jgi:diguanylate cyclase (GGDEF)-like protein/PAS domain S-box-containing protein